MSMIRAYTTCLIITTTLCVCQPTSGQSALVSFRETLQHYGVPLTRPGLVDALRSPVPEVRSTAALELAEMQFEDSSISIATALEREKVASVRADMAVALAQLGDERGKEALRKTCDDEGQRDGIRLKAAWSLIIELRDENCLDAVRHLLNNTDSAYRYNALELAKNFHRLDGSDAQVLSDCVAPSLSDPEARIRTAASSALAELGRPASIALIENALSGEHDQDVRLQMSKDVARMRQKTLRP
jgi:HEAT repeat protein